MRRERLHLQAKHLRVFTYDGRGEEERDVKNVLGSKRLVEFGTVSSQRADAALFVLIVEREFRIELKTGSISSLEQK